MARRWGDALQQRQIIRIGDDIPKLISAPSIIPGRVGRLIIAATVGGWHARFIVLLVAVLILIFLGNIARAEHLYPPHFTTMRSLIKTEQGLGDFGRSEEGRQSQEMSYVRFPRFVP